MIEKTYFKTNDILYKKILNNGLTVFLIPKSSYYKTYALLSADYGSMDNHFEMLGNTYHVPDGTAHFLEHKLFEKEKEDIFQKFGEQGASANAFTSFHKTNYLFSATENIEKNLLTLIDFVQNPYFTKKTVEKEKGIIEQEIEMYKDDPDWCQFFGILKNLFPKHPLHIDIAGTIESIFKITAEDLYNAYNAFYQPSNMTLFIIGNIDVHQTIELIEKNQNLKTFSSYKKVNRYFPNESYQDILSYSSLKMLVNRTKSSLGIRGLEKNLPQMGKDILRYRTSIELLFELLLGKNSSHYLRIYDEGLIDDTFNFSIHLYRNFHFAHISSDTDFPKKFSEKIREILLMFKKDPLINEENLNLSKRKMLGKYFQSLNSLDYIANQFIENLFDDVTFFDLPEIIENISLEDIQKVGEKFINEQGFSSLFLRNISKLKK